ncbi:MAG: VWA domain-containing protein [Anaerolineaceae bacterium]|nr:VWA domain-containing protein [Anaerolineaceae bacterium]
MSFRFASPWLLLLLALLPILGAWPYLRKGRNRPAALRYADNRLTQVEPRSLRLILRPFMPALRLLAIALLIIAAARPQTGFDREIIQGEGVDIALALDISGSMASLDFEPQNRLEAAKEVISNFIAERPYDRVGLVVFASSAFHQSPPTVDHDVLLRLLESIQLATELNIEDGTALGMGLANAASMLKDSSAKSRIVILLTDGVNNAGPIDPLTAAEAARALDIKVYTIGMGRPGEVPFPIIDAFGREQIVYQESELDEDTLHAIANTTGGLYFRVEDPEGLRQTYTDINNLEQSQFEVETYTRYTELASWFLVPALLLLLLDMILQRTIFKVIP